MIIESKRKKRLMTPALSITLIATLLLVFSSFGCDRGAKKSSRFNLLLVTLDGVGSGKIGPKIAKPMETPVIDRLWTQGTVLTRVIAASPLRGPSYGSIFTGLYPPGHGTRDDRTDKLSENATTIAEILKKAGWDTGAVVSNVDTMALWGFNQGFDYYDDEVARSPLDQGLPRPQWAPITTARDVTAKAVRWLADVGSSEKPWFLWVEYSDALPPRNIPAPFPDLFPGNPFAASLTYMDANLGVLLGKLRDFGQSDNTLVVVTSAHGLPFGEHGETAIAVFAYMSTVSVPAIFVLPGSIPPNKEISLPVGAVDLAPTILELLRIPAPGKIDGRSVAAAIQKNKVLKPRPIYSENLYASRWLGCSPILSLVSGDYHYLAVNPPELYNLANDPAEQVNVFNDKNKNLGEEMKKNLNSLLDDMEGDAKKREDDSKVESEVEDQLRKFGYISPSDKEQLKRMENLTKDEVLVILARIQSARKARSEGKNDVAEQEYGKLLQDYPGLGWVAYELAELLKGRGALSEAEAMYKKGVAFGPYYVRAASMIGLARLMALNDQTAEAENLLKMAVRLIPNNAEVYTDLGNVYLSEKAPDDAEKMFRKAIELDPKSYRAHFGLASVFSTDYKRAPAAAGELEYVFKYYPDYPPAHLMFARIAMQFGNKAEAEKHLKKIMETSPGSAIASQAKEFLEKINKPETTPPQPAGASPAP